MEKQTIAKKTPTAEQQTAIDVRKNAVVAAGAGSGKTTVLSLRFLDLIKNSGLHAEEILTLTFTNKATVEMSDRIYKVLKNEAPEEAAVFYKANIKTLDSYCNTVAKQGCRFYGISPDFIQDNEALKKLVKDKALPFLLKHRDNPVIRHFINTQDYEKIAQELFVDPIMNESTIAEPLDFRKKLSSQYERISQEWKKAVRKMSDILAAAERFDSEFEGNREAKFFIEYKKIMAENPIPEDPPLSVKDIAEGKWEDISEYAAQISRFVFSKPGNTKGAEGFGVIVDEYRKELPEIISLCNYVYGVKFVNELIPLLEEFQEIVNEIKRTTNCLSFKDISNMALCILRDYPEIRRLEKKKYKAIMIDEFQDNNQDQRDMLFLLAEKMERMEKGVPDISELCPEKLFFVGDEKQSIYRFRGADVEVFNNLSKDFKDGNLSMSTNHRSHPALISAFNTIFGGERFGSAAASSVDFITTPPAVFYNEKKAESAEGVPPYEAVYHSVLVPERKKDIKISEPHIHIAVYDESADAEDNDLIKEEAEAEWVARKIDEKIAAGINPSDIAVLFRSYSYQQLYERTFLRHGIPYNTAIAKGFFSDGPVSDIIAYLKMIVSPEDTISYGQVLRSPFVNLSLLETEAVLSLKEKPFANESLSVLEEEAAIKYKAAAAFYEKVSETQKEKNLAETITLLWYEGGYRFETMWNKTVKMYEKLYDLLFELARNADAKNKNLSMFVDEINLYKDESRKLEDVEIPLEKAEGVQIMSIYKSKGLEFPVVFICNTSNSGKNETNSNPLYISSEYGITVNSPVNTLLSFDGKDNYFYNAAKCEESNKAAAELRRVCYVALTRAIDEVYITSASDKVMTAKKQSDYRPGGTDNPKSLLQVLHPLIKFYSQDEHKNASPFTEVETIPPYARNEVYEGKGRPNTISAKAALIKQLKEINLYENAEILEKECETLKYISPSKLHADDDETKSERGEIIQDIKDVPYAKINKIINKYSPSFSFTNFGTIAHAYMEALINETAPVYSNSEITGLQADTAAYDEIKAICGEMQEKFKSFALGKAAMAAEWHRAEYTFRSFVAGKIISGSIDLVFENSDGTYTIVDYKTNQTVEPEIYYNQLACYRQAVSQMMNVNADKVSCWLYYLRYDRAENITEKVSKVNLEEAVKLLDD